MFNKITPEQAGISSRNILDFLRTLDQYGFSTHDVIMARGNDIFFECYYKPFDKDFKHRLYSSSKSFVAIAIGLAIDDGLLSLDDKFIKFFPEAQNENLDDYLAQTTIRDMLTMSTSMQRGVDWFGRRPDDRVPIYFMKKSDKIPGTIYEYDSSGSYMLGVIVERLTGKPFLKYMQEKFLDDIGFSKDAYCIQSPGGYSFADSGVVCTARDFLAVARFTMNKGEWNGKQYMSREFLEDATSRLVDNQNGFYQGGFHGYGYGYQIWKTPRDGFLFTGMGGQYAICDPKTDTIIIMNSDNQFNPYSETVTFHEIYKNIFPAIGEPLAEDKEAQKELEDYVGGLELMSLKDDSLGFGAFAEKVNGVTYRFDRSQTEIEYMRLDFQGDKGTITYLTPRGEKVLPFGMGYNIFGLFPEKGYPNMIATKCEPGHQYQCAASATWVEEQKLKIKVQIIDNYFGNATFILSFKDDKVTMWITKNAEAFMYEYNVFATGTADRLDNK